MTRRRMLLWLSCVALVCLGIGARPVGAAEEGFRPLFNGQDISGWVPVNTAHRSKPTPHWNHYRITCNDGSISLAVNGKVVTKGTDAIPRKGYICLESEGGIVHYRNLRIKELPDTPVAPEHVAIADRGYRSLYTGVDLSGWNMAEGAKGHWRPSNWVLRYDGKAEAADAAIVTEQSFGDFGFLFDVRRGDRLLLTLNGHVLFEDRQVSGAPARGPLRIVPAGPIEFANLFVRDAAAETE